MSGNRFKGRNVFVTGAGSGFGRATALAFAREGATHVFLADLRGDRLGQVAEDVRAAGSAAHSFALDIVDPHAIDLALEQVCTIDPQLHVMVSNAAYFGLPTPVLELKDEEWRREIDTSLSGAYVLANRAAQAMVREHVAGSILFTASISSTSAAPGLAAYCATKAAIVMLAKVLALELAPHAIRVNCVSPGPADTQRAIDLLGQERIQALRKGNLSIPLRRLAIPEDVAEAFLYLASDEAAYITGQNLVVDGGLSLRSDALDED